jgi:acetyl esterase/lipase
MNGRPGRTRRKAVTRLRRFVRCTIAAMLPVLALTACSPLRMFNTLLPKDGGSRLVLRGAAFGPDPRQRLDLYAPTTASTRPWPVIIFIYGGSWKSGLREGYGFVGRALAARGFLVAIPDYRLVPDVRYPVFLEDNAAAVHWVVAHAGEYHADAQRMIIAGHSAGAYNAAMLAYDPRWLGADRAAVRGFIGLAGPPPASADRRPASRRCRRRRNGRR